MGISLAIHVLAIVVWVGGMFFAYVCLRPVAASQLEPPIRLNLWRGVFSRFFPFVWAAIVLTPLTGIGMIMARGGFSAASPYVHLMTLLGIIMILIFLHVFFAPFKRLKRSLDESDIPAAAKQLNTIRIMVGINTALGLITIIVATAGKYYLA